MQPDESENVPSEYVTGVGNDAIYRSPPGRFIVTPETPFGHIDRDVDTAVRLWGQLGLPLKKDRLSKPDDKNNDPPRRTSLERRIDRGKRGVRKGNILANRRFHSSFMSREGSEADIAKIINAVARIDRSDFVNPELTQDNIIKSTLLAKRQLAISRRTAGRDEKVFLATLRRQIDRTSKMLEMLSVHSTLRRVFDLVLAKHVVRGLDNAKVTLLFEVEQSQLSTMKKLLYFGSASEISHLVIQLLATSTNEILKDIEGAGKVV